MLQFIQHFTVWQWVGLFLALVLIFYLGKFLAAMIVFALIAVSGGIAYGLLVIYCNFIKPTINFILRRKNDS